MLRQFQEIAINQLMIDKKIMLEADNLARAKNILSVHALIRLNAADPNKLLAAWAHSHHLRIADLDAMDIPNDIIALIPDQIAKQNRSIPIDRVGNNIILALENPQDINIINLLQLKTGYLIKTVLASEEKITKALARYYPNRGVEIEKFSKTNTLQNKPKATEQRMVIGDLSLNDEGSVIDLINRIMMICLQRGASDIHVEPYETYLRVRLRIDGSLQEITRLPAQVKAAMASRFKVMAGMKIEEKRLPQDGQISVTIEGKPIDFRINTLPTWHGEKVVLRILDKSSLQVDMTKLGFEVDDLVRFKDCIHKPYGMVLVTGPTGSGKTTTLYSALAELNQVTDNIITAEDPVEFTLDGINQVHIRSDYGMTFSDALKAFLRQDPDIIMVGEIRDRDTGEVAIKAALTGHMVLSTLHTNSAADTIVRLQNMGLESFNLISALQCVVAQRLARRICVKCKIVDSTIKPDYLISLGVPAQVAATAKVHKGQGCDACGDTGMKGRIAIHEVLVMNDELRAAIMKGAPAMELKAISMRNSMRSIRQNALVKMLRGEMDILEVVSNTNGDDERLETSPTAA